MTHFTDAGLARIDELVADAVEQEQAPGLVAAVATGDVLHLAHAGAMAVDGPPMERKTLFRLASITKPMTAAVVLSLIQDGAFELDEPVDRLLPELADRRVLRRPDGPLDDTVPANRAITVRDLLTFTWGFGLQGALFVAPQRWPIHTATLDRDLATFGPPRPEAVPDPDTWIARLGELPLLLQPGEKWLYNSGAQVLGVLIARATGQRFDDVMRERLFGPLDMTDAGFAADPQRLATAYARREGQLVITDPPDGAWSRQPVFPDGGAGVVASADDVVTFGRMLLRGGMEVLRPETVAEMTRNQLTPAQRRYEWPGFDLLGGRGWGYGLSVLDDGRYFWDGGSGTAWSNVPSLDLTVVVLTQRAWDETGPPAVCDAVLEAAKAAVQV